MMRKLHNKSDTEYPISNTKLPKPTRRKLVFRVIPFLALALFLTACGQSAERLNNKGNEEFGAAQYEVALNSYRQAQVEAPDVPEPYYNAANVFYRQGDMEQAELQARQSLRNASDNLAQNAFFNLGNTFFNSGRFPDAAEAYKQALRLDPADVDAKYNLELTLEILKQQQQDQEGQPDPNSDEEPQDQDNQSEQNQPNDEGQSEQEEEQQDQQQQQPSPNEQNQDEQSQPQQQQNQNQIKPQQGLTEDQARQLLDAIAQDTENLHEHLQQIIQVAGDDPDQDW